MVVGQQHHSVPPSAPPADICPSSPPPSYAFSPTELRINDNNTPKQQQQQGKTAKNILPTFKSAKNAEQMREPGGRIEMSQPTSTTVVVPMTNDKVTILCLGQNIKYCRPDRFDIFPAVSGHNSNAKMRKLLAFSCCAISIIIFGFFAFAIGFIVLVLINSQSTENDSFDHYQMRMFGHHFG